MKHIGMSQQLDYDKLENTWVFIFKNLRFTKIHFNPPWNFTRNLQKQKKKFAISFL